MLEPYKRCGLSLPRLRMGVKDTSPANCSSGRRLPENKPVAGDQHDLLGELDAHQANRSRLNCFMAIQRNARHRLGGERVEMNTCAMFQRGCIFKKPDLRVDGVDRRKRIDRKSVV